VVVVLGVSNFWGDIVWFFQTDSERIQGRWKSVPTVLDAGRVAYSSFGDCTFKDDPIPFARDSVDGKSTADYRLDEDHQPGWIDMTIDEFNDKSPLLGIYELKRNTLRIRFHGYGESRRKRPNKFEPKAPPNHVPPLVFKRE
jgi:uncharacterized protein (TIGR03067 family)